MLKKNDYSTHKFGNKGRREDLSIEDLIKTAIESLENRGKHTGINVDECIKLITN